LATLLEEAGREVAAPEHIARWDDGRPPRR